MRPLLWLLPCLILAGTACEQFTGGGQAPPVDPGPIDPGPDPVLPPDRDVVMTPTPPVTAGTTVTLSTTGEDFREGDSITWTLEPESAVLEMLPANGGPLIFPEATRLITPITTDSVSPVPARFRPAVPGAYTLRVREQGVDYDPVVRTFALNATAASGSELRPEATEITGLPAFGDITVIEEVLTGAHSLAVSPDLGDGLGEWLVLLVRQTRKDEVSGDAFHEHALYLGHVASGIWSLPVVLSTDPADRVLANPQFGLREYTAGVQQSLGIAVAGRTLYPVWTDAAAFLTTRTVTLSGPGPTPAITFGPRLGLTTTRSLRLVPLTDSAGRLLLPTTSGTPVQAQSLATLRTNGTAAPELFNADVIRSSEATARVGAHDAVLGPDGRLHVVTFERGQASDSTPDLVYHIVSAAYTATTTQVLLTPNVRSVEAPRIAINATGDVLIACGGDPEGHLHFRPATGAPQTRAVPLLDASNLRTVNLAFGPADTWLLLLQYGTGLVIENVQGSLRLIRGNAGDGLAALDLEGTPLPASVLETLDNGPGLMARSGGGLHVVWPENGIGGLNRNTRLLEAREG